MQTRSVDQLVGQVLRNYRVERLLGKGRLNAVYLARNTKSQDTVALTLFIVPERLSPDACNRFLRRFQEEADILVSLRHRHILPVYEYGDFAGYPYLVTPYMMNGSLADLLKKEGSCTHEQVRDILEQIADGLTFAHTRGVVHGILKPANIVSGPGQTLMVAGFGLMHILQRRGIEQDTQTYGHLLSIANTFLIASEYVAPEVVQGYAVDARSDIYALGAILFELLSGRPPFEGDDPLKVARMHLEQTFPSLRALCPGVPIALESVVNQALERNPARRFQQVRDLVEAFTQVTRGVAHFAGNNTRANDASTELHKLSERSIPVAPQKERRANPAHGDVSAASTSETKSSKALAQTQAEDVVGCWQLQPPIITGKVATIRPAIRSAEKSSGEKKLEQPPRAGQKNAPVISQKGEATTSSYLSFSPAATSVPPVSGQTTFDRKKADDRWTHPEQPWETVQASMNLVDLESTRWLPGSSGPLTAPLKSTHRAGRHRRDMKRRQMLALLATGGVAAASTAVVLNTHLLRSVGSLLNPRAGNGAVANGKTPVGRDQGTQPVEAPIGSTKQAVNSAVFFPYLMDKQRGVLIRQENGDFVAYDRACTHAGVLVKYDPDSQLLLCPAHDAVFDPANKGAVVQGPARKPLPSVAIRVKGDGTIMIA
jgi:serine/threonine protein kinase/Rieske Fe-S protein